MVLGAVLRIGGNLEEKYSGHFCWVICEEVVSVDGSDWSPTCSSDLIESASKNGSILELQCKIQHPFANLLLYCIQYKLSYRRWQTASNYTNSTVVWWDLGMEKAEIILSDATIPFYYLVPWDSCEDFKHPPKLPPFRIV
jgi:hypothetical protein